MVLAGESYLFVFLAGVALINVSLMIVAFVLLRRLRNTQRRYQLLMQGPTGEDLDGVLRRQATDLEAGLRRLDTLEKQRLADRSQLKSCVQRVGMVRFNAFSDTGSDLSFAVALLDEDGDGVVVTSLFGRDQSRIYGKPVQAAQSAYALTDEEKEAIVSAMARNS